jgi:hypothetical protein
LATEVDAAAVGEANVQDGYVDVGDIEYQRLVKGSGLGDDLEVALGLEQLSKAPSHDFVVIYEE